MNLRALFVACIAALSGCASTGPGGIGAIATGLTGGAGGQKGSAAIIEALGGGLVAGIELDARDRRSALQAEYRALEYTPSGQQVVWRSSDTLYGEVVAATPYRVGSQDCRQYTHKVYSGGQPKIMRGTACRNGDGSWTLLT